MLAWTLGWKRISKWAEDSLDRARIEGIEMTSQGDQRTTAITPWCGPFACYGFDMKKSLRTFIGELYGQSLLRFVCLLFKFNPLLEDCESRSLPV